MNLRVGIPSIGMRSAQTLYQQYEAAALKAARDNDASLWYVGNDPTGFVFVDAAGTTPSGNTDPIGLMLDRQYGAANLGPELAGSLNTWTPGTGWAVAGSTLVASAAGAFSSSSVAAVLVAGRTYRVEYTISAYSAGSVRLRFLTGTATTAIDRTSAGTFSEFIVANTGNATIAVQAGASGFTGAVSAVSVREVLGIPALQATADNRPTLELQANGFFGMRFDGTNDGLNISPIQVINFNSNTVIVAGRLTSGTSGGCFSQRSSVSDTPITAQLEFNSAGARYIHRSTVGVITQAIGVTTGSSNAVLSGVSVDGSPRVLYVNGAVSATSANTAGSANVTTQTLGYYNTPAPGSYLNGVLHLICAAPAAMPDADRIAIERFAALLSGAAYP